MKTILSLLGLTFLILACAGRADERGSPARPRGTAASGTGGGSQPASAATAAALRSALDRAIAEPGSWSDLHLQIECQGERGVSSVEAFGNGVAVWEGRRQFALTPVELAGLVEVLRKADFAGMKETYGGRGPDLDRPPVQPSDPTAAVVMICRVGLVLDGLSKEVVQLAKGEQSARFLEMADRLVELCLGPARAGVGAADLGDGLEKLSTGVLAPEVFGLLVHRRPDEASAAAGNRGFLLRLTGRRLTSQEFDPAGGYAPELGLELTPAEIADLARRLAAADPASLPVNLWARDYTDLAIRVLDHRKSVQARQFARMTRDTHGERQQRFETLYARLYDLHLRVLDEGRSLPPAGG